MNLKRFGMLTLALASAAFVSGALAQNAAPRAVAFTAGARLVGPVTVEPGYARVTLKNTTQRMMAHEIARIKDGVSSAEGLKAVRVMWGLEKGDDHAAMKKLEFYGGATFVAPGKSGWVGMNLKPGNYVSYADTIGDKGPEVLAGHLTAFTVRAGQPVGQAPKPDHTLKMVDFAFAFPPEVRAGKHVFRVENAGKELHLMFMGKIKPGKTFADVQEWERKNEQGPSPVEDATQGIHLLSSGLYNDVELSLEPGVYAVICFIDGHHFKGMLLPLTVKP